MMSGIHPATDDELEPFGIAQNAENLDTAIEAALEEQQAAADVDAEGRRDVSLAGAHEGTLDTVQAYLNEMGRVPLLTAAEEIELAERIARGEAARRKCACSCRGWCAKEWR